MKPIIILDESHFVDDVSGETVVRYIPRLAPGPGYRGVIKFPVFDALQVASPEKHREVKAQAVQCASDVLADLFARSMDQITFAETRSNPPTP